MPSSATESQRVRSRFRSKAQAFDDLYEDERLLVRLLRPGLLRRRQLAADTVREYGAARVLDVGCGSGRIAEFVLDAGAAEYLGIDFSDEMLELSRERLARYGDRVELVLGDFLAVPIDRRFDLVLALGLFDYLPHPERFARRMAELCAPGGCMVGSFPKWSLLKGPIRKVRYEWLGDCPIFDYPPSELERMLRSSGFERVELHEGRAGSLVRAFTASPA
jgi:SAM-dependent methyltransferase